MMIVNKTPIHDAFGLTYASWFIVPRIILEAMPVEWQEKFVNLISELNDTYDWEPEAVMQIMFREKGKFASTPECFTNYRHPNYEWLDLIKVKEPK